MTKQILVTMSVLAALSACGPGAKVGGGKQGAAQALMAASAPTKAGSDKASGGVDLTGAVSYTCPEGGNAQLQDFTTDVSTGTTVSVSQKFNIVYQGCGLAKSEAGTAAYDGTLAVVQKVVTGAAGVTVEQTFSGKVTIGGAFDDFLDVSATQKIDVASLGANGGSVSMHLDGTVADTSGSYTYNEQVDVTAGSIVVDVSQR